MSINPSHGVRYDLLQKENVITVSDSNQQQVKNNNLNAKILNTNKLISESKDKLLLKREELDRILKDNSISKEDKRLLLEQKQKINKVLKELNVYQATLNKARKNEISVKEDVEEKTESSIRNLSISSTEIIMAGSMMLIGAGILAGCTMETLEISKGLCAAGGLILAIGTPAIVKDMNYF